MVKVITKITLQQWRVHMLGTSLLASSSYVSGHIGTPRMCAPVHCNNLQSEVHLLNIVHGSYEVHSQGQQSELKTLFLGILLCFLKLVQASRKGTVDLQLCLVGKILWKLVRNRSIFSSPSSAKPNRFSLTVPASNSRFYSVPTGKNMSNGLASGRSRRYCTGAQLWPS